MKEIIKSYYSLDHIKKYYIINNSIHFTCKGINYIFEPINDRKYIKSVYEITQLNKNYDQIVLNIYKKIYTTINNIDYVLIKCNVHMESFIDNIFNNKNFFEYNNYLNRSNWIELWTKKIDFYEYQHNYIKTHDFLFESLNYYLGMAENAVSYIKYNIKQNNKPLVLSHKRIEKNNFYNPLNLIIDYRARDISEYLKYIFFTKKYKKINFYNFFIKLNFDRSDYILLYGRLLFPSYYFDLYDQIINNNLEQKKILDIISRTKEYEKYIKNIYNTILKIVDIPKIEWL